MSLLFLNSKPEIDQKIRDASKRGAANTFLAFTLPKCRACTYMEQAFLQIQKDTEIEFVICKHDESTSNGSELIDEFAIDRFPTVVWLKNGNEQIRWGGFFLDEDPRMRLANFRELLVEHNLTK